MSNVWLITGCSRGLGRAFAEAALANGDQVAANSNRNSMGADKGSNRQNKTVPPARTKCRTLPATIETPMPDSTRSRTVEMRSGSLTTCFLFQVKDGLTDGGLGDVNPAGSFREIQMLGYGSEVTQVTQFHFGKPVYRQKLSVP
jgi:hypothetical protein